MASWTNRCTSTSTPRSRAAGTSPPRCCWRRSGIRSRSTADIGSRCRRPAAPTRCRSSAVRGSPTGTTCSPSRLRSSSTSRRTCSSLWGNDENFFEWSPGRILFINGGLTWRPTGKLRLDGTYALQQVRRVSDGSMVNIAHLPRLKMEYQLSRPDLHPPRRRVQPREAGLPARRHPHRGAAAHLRPVGQRLRADPGVHPQLVPGRRAVLVSAESGNGRVSRLWEHAAGSDRSDESARDGAAEVRGRVLPEDELSVSHVALGEETMSP